MGRKLDNKRMEVLLNTAAEYEEFMELCRDAESGMLEKVPGDAAPDYQSFLRLLHMKERSPEK